MERESMPVFVRIEDYKDILDIMEVLKTSIEEAKKTLAKISELKNKEDAELVEWKSEIIDVEKKVDYIDHILFEPENV